MKATKSDIKISSSIKTVKFPVVPLNFPILLDGIMDNLILKNYINIINLNEATLTVTNEMTTWLFSISEPKARIVR